MHMFNHSDLISIIELHWLFYSDLHMRDIRDRLHHNYIEKLRREQFLLKWSFLLHKSSSLQRLRNSNKMHVSIEKDVF